MSGVFLILGAVFAAFAGVIHLLIFSFESISWRQPATWRRFGIRTQEDADVLAPMAYNQGFYNLFLALGTAAGLVMLAIPAVTQAGLGLTIFTLLSMLLASLVLITSNRSLARAAMLQGGAPFVGLIFLVLAILTA